MNKTVYIVTESSGFFGQQLNPWETLDINTIRAQLEENYAVKVVTWYELANATPSPKGEVIIHSSSQQPEYKSYIDDIMLFLQENGNLLIPSVHTTRSHENKGYQEMHKRMLEIPAIESRYACKIAELDIPDNFFPAVLKSLSGFGSSSVSIVNSRLDLLRAVNKQDALSWKLLPKYWRSLLVSFVKKHVLRRKNILAYGDYYQSHKRFVLQKLVPDLKLDYKVLIFQTRAFVRKRFVRPGDFRASGSGIGEWEPIPKGLLEFAKTTLDAFGEPYMSLDIVECEGGFEIIEFQGVHFGPIFIHTAPFHFHFRKGKWDRNTETISVEALIGESLSIFLQNKSCR